MELISDNRFGEIWFDTNENMYEYRWKKETSYMKDQEFQKILISFSEMLIGKGTSKFLVDALQKEYTVSNELQEWHDQVIVPKYIEAGITHLAFVINENSIVDISIELTFEEENSRAQLVVKFFKSKIAARNWLLDGKLKRA